MKITRREFLIATAATSSLLASKAWALKKEDEQAWNAIRKFLFADQPIHDANGIVTLDVPGRTPNGGDVTIKVLSSYSQTNAKFIAKHYLVVDKNPSPIAAEFSLSPQITADISTRIRVHGDSTVRVIAQTNEGNLYMDTAYVRTSGECSLSSTGDDSMAKLMIGKTRLTWGTSAQPSGTYDFNLAITHPNHSGLQKDQITTYFIPPHYIETVQVTNQAGTKIFAVKGDISFSENPSFSFAYAPTRGNDILWVKVVDSHKKIYESQWPLALV